MCGDLSLQSIFDLEKRSEFSPLYESFIRDLNSTKVKVFSRAELPLVDYLKSCFRFWPHRCGASTIDEYLQNLRIDDVNYDDNLKPLYLLELWINLLHWAPVKEKQDNAFGLIPNGSQSVSQEAKRLIENAQYILEQSCNMTIREESASSFNKYRISKRDVNVDAAVATVPNLNNILLGYMDVRNRYNMEYKKNALTEIYGYLEPKRKDYKGKAFGAISEEFFHAMNSFKIRHNNKKQVELIAEGQMELYDRLFSLAIFVLQAPYVQESMNYVKQMEPTKTSKSHKTQ